MSSAPAINVRLATLQDAEAITALYTSQVQTWRHVTFVDQPTAAYAELGLYERWLNGGMHSSVELCAIHLHRLAGGSGTALVACYIEDDSESEPLAEAEIYESDEGEPFGSGLSIATLGVHARYRDQRLADTLIDYIVRMAQVSGRPQISIVVSGDGEPRLIERRKSAV